MDTSYAVGVGIAAVTMAAGAFYYAANTPHKYLKDLTVLDNQSIQLKDGSRMSAFCSMDEFKEVFYDRTTTTYEIFLRGLKISENGQCLASCSGPSGEYQWLSYQTVYDMARHFGSGLLNLGLESGQNTFVGIYCTNRVEWVVVDLACVSFSMVTVPFYDTLSTAGCAYIINLIEIQTLMCDTEARINNLLSFHNKIPTLKRIISLVDVSDAVKELARSMDVEIVTYSQVIEYGKAKSHELKPCRPDDLYTICCTSGTTGVPKGVKITHRNVLAQVSVMVNLLQERFPLTSEDRHLSYLPLAHVYERIVQQYVFIHGAKVGFFCGDVKLLLNDLQSLKPTFFFTVPRLVNRIYEKVQQGVNSSRIKQFMFNMAINSKTKELKQGIIRNNSIWDKLMFKKVSQLFGGCVKFIVVTSAPLSTDILTFLRCAAGCAVMEAYGSSEMCGGVTGTILGEFNTGHVGPPLPGYIIKLVDVPEKNYYAEKGQGEVCVKGAAVCSGYYCNEENTTELIDSEGWCHSGDIGEWLHNGVLRIIGRKKDIFKLSQGEYIAVEKIENVYLLCPSVLQIFVTGDSLQDFPVAVVVPDPDVLLPWANTTGITGTITELSKNEVVRDYILKGMRAEGKRQNLCSVEQVRKIHIHPDPLTIEAGLLTPTMKNRRPALENLFCQVIADLYKSQ